ncbi:hypothetical protein TRFO_05402 [Tritrichomonas foetus]|uniref:Myeloid leukemia factor n=1 Tax=Tritrichomonas foetus TaxID=1144522 RepID=A0A1J4K5Q6_9EUKA|nr:hypothetical protein [Tritrichomonas foetus]OHT06735.1 hypothetical protein TRFO_05402 [Tritrichomonas foetus]|eukprot:OHT06735.1 hypothetical protein TRFO_05402 [Tritrichomonas foetus]
MDSWFNDPFFNSSNDPHRDIHSHFEQMHRQMNNMMNSMFSNMGDFGMPSMPGIGFDNGFDDGFSRSRPSRDSGHSRSRDNYSHNRYNDGIMDAEEVSPSYMPSSKHSKNTPIVEEPDDYNQPPPRSNHHQSRNNFDDNFSSHRSSYNRSSGQPQTYFYSSTMTSYSGPDGVQHARKKTYDSTTGKTEMAEMRKLGDQAVAMKREIDRDGHVTDMMDKRNLDESELNDFSQRWNRNARNPSLGFGGDDFGGHRHHHRALK